MTLLESAAILLAGVGAGTINTVVGSGTLITFPTLLAFGVPPVTANMSNSLGLVPGSVAGAVGYRRELVGQRTRVARFLVLSLSGGVLGAVLLLVLPADAFEAIVPALIGLGVILVAFGPRLSAYVAAHRDTDHQPRTGVRGWIPVAIFATGIYGGYFGAAQGVLLMGVLGLGLSDTLQRLNAMKNVLAAGVNLIAGVIFALVAELDLFGQDADVDWTLVALIGVGAVIGGFVGASIGRRLPPLA
ncbi:MAG: sulfite exporter TauE/SafE family protein, partial [Nocardioidaceae bacterium]|nr:sulfite exporter TauE/SafE family protein [Nocardioidaceae bacterium]